MEASESYGPRGKVYKLDGRVVTEAEFNAHFAERERETAEALQTHEGRREIAARAQKAVREYEHNPIMTCGVTPNSARAHHEKCKAMGLVGVETLPSGDLIFAGAKNRADYIKAMGFADKTSAGADRSVKKKKLIRTRKKKNARS